MRVNGRRVCRGRGGRRGAIAVEFAIILPLLMLIVLGCIDFGRFAYAYITVTNAARAGAGYGSVNPPTTATMGTWKTQIRQAVAEDAGSLGDFDASTVDIPNPLTESGGLWRVQVTASYEFKTLVSWPGIPASTTLRRTVEMRGTR